MPLSTTRHLLLLPFLIPRLAHPSSLSDKLPMADNAMKSVRGLGGLAAAARSALILCVFLLAAFRASAQRLVFAHYMLTNQDYQADSDPTQELKIAAYEREIRQAQAVGIDGFAFNAGGWLRQPYYIRYAAQMFEAAVRLHSGIQAHVFSRYVLRQRR